MAARSSLNVLVIALLSVVVLGLIFGIVLQDKALQKAKQMADGADKGKKAAEAAHELTKQERAKLREFVTGSIEAVDPAQIEDYLTQAVKDLDAKMAGGAVAAVEKKGGNFRDVVAGYRAAVARLMASVEEASRSSSDANQRGMQREEKHKADIESYKKQVLDRDQELQRVRSEIADMESAKADLEARLNRQLTEKDDDFTQLSYRFDTEKTLAAQKIAQANDTINRLRLERIPEKDLAKADPHGAILRVANKHTAYIDKGRRDFVRPGLAFQVYEQRGAVRFNKGMVEINRVEDTWSQVTITQPGTELEPIIAGDKIWSPFFKKEQAPRVAIAGEKLATPLLSLDLMKRKLSDAGVTVTADVGVDTDYVIAIEGYQDSAVYEKARTHGVMILRESEILAYVLQ
ncbi:MAG TPA: hypothetical protein DCM87_14185 [Planctomycetes bacterium]|nr:hypothetical protein [Planctomycetota bacterium]